VILLAVACAIALLRRAPLEAAAATTALAGANLSTALLKHLFETARIQPTFVNGEPLPTGIFPSGHATAAASVAIAFAFVVPRASLRLAALIGALYVIAVDVAVLILAWHYPSDVLAGTLVAATWGFVALAGLRALRPAPVGLGRSPLAEPDAGPDSAADRRPRGAVAASTE
jgi:membrane-associated phospholipid phosphatase